MASEIGRRIRAHREGLVSKPSQEGLADIAGLHRTYIGHVERGEINITVWNLVQIAAALDIDAGELTAGLRP